MCIGAEVHTLACYAVCYKPAIGLGKLIPFVFLGWNFLPSILWLIALTKTWKSTVNTHELWSGGWVNAGKTNSRTHLDLNPNVLTTTPLQRSRKQNYTQKHCLEASTTSTDSQRLIQWQTIRVWIPLAIPWQNQSSCNTREKCLRGIHIHILLKHWLCTQTTQLVGWVNG